MFSFWKVLVHGNQLHTPLIMQQANVYSSAYLAPFQTSMMDAFGKIVNGPCSVILFAKKKKKTIIDVW